MCSLSLSPTLSPSFPPPPRALSRPTCSPMPASTRPPPVAMRCHSQSLCALGLSLLEPMALQHIIARMLSPAPAPVDPLHPRFRPGDLSSPPSPPAPPNQARRRRASARRQHAGHRRDRHRRAAVPCQAAKQCVSLGLSACLSTAGPLSLSTSEIHSPRLPSPPLSASHPLHCLQQASPWPSRRLLRFESCPNVRPRKAAPPAPLSLAPFIVP